MVCDSKADLPLQQHHDGGVQDRRVRPGEERGEAQHHDLRVKDQAVRVEQRQGVHGQLPRHGEEHGGQQDHVLDRRPHVDEVGGGGGTVKRKLDTVKLRRKKMDGA